MNEEYFVPEEREEKKKRKKPLLARLLNKLGIPTGPVTEWIIDWVQVFIVAGFLAWFVMTFVLVRMRVPTGSMKPTIQEGSSFFVDKISYYFRKPDIGDIVVFWHQESDKKVRYVKRLIAIGGQTVEIKEGDLYVNGAKLTDPAFQRYYYCYPNRMNNCQWTVPEHKYFLLGDNSRNSRDSRYWGFADQKDFIGEPFFRVWPLSRIGFMNGYFGSNR